VAKSDDEYTIVAPCHICIPGPHRISEESAKLPVATGKSGQLHGRDSSGVAQRATPETETTLADLHGSEKANRNRQ